MNLRNALLPIALQRNQGALMRLAPRQRLTLSLSLPGGCQKLAKRSAEWQTAYASMSCPNCQHAMRLGITQPRRHWHGVLCGLLRLAIEPGACAGKAVNAGWQNNPRLGRRRPDVACKLNGIGVVVAATRDGADVRPALKREAHRGAAAWAKVDKDFFLAAV